jgi:hypothetical protein
MSANVALNDVDDTSVAPHGLIMLCYGTEFRRLVLAARTPERGRRDRWPAGPARPPPVPVLHAHPDRRSRAARIRPRSLPGSGRGIPAHCVRLPPGDGVDGEGVMHRGHAHLIPICVEPGLAVALDGRAAASKDSGRVRPRTVSALVMATPRPVDQSAGVLSVSKKSAECRCVSRSKTILVTYKDDAHPCVPVAGGPVVTPRQDGVVAACRDGPGAGASLGRASGPRRSSAPKMTAPPANRPAQHQNTVM